MLTSIVKATRAHYAALQHKGGQGRTRLSYRVTSGTVEVTAGCVWVRVGDNGTYTRAHKLARRKAEVTRLLNRLRSMYPEHAFTCFHCWFE